MLLKDTDNNLLASHDSWHHNARVNWEPVPGPDGVLLGFNVPNGFSTYAEGFKRVADIAVDHVDEHHSDAAVVVYAVMFAYRQYFELRLKEFISTGGELFDQDLALPTSHNLVTLWQTVRPVLERYWRKTSGDKELSSVEDVIVQLAALDPRSTAFRYPVDTQLQPSLTGITYINLRQVRDVIDRVAPILDGSSYALEASLDTKAELEAEAYQEAMQYEDHEGEPANG